ncbi:hypothetical protein [Cytobacillus purgationiresistens]|uniref:Lipoprotein n=1 Tax=Cytobacillus purgationiresistens TaxID=863449 RepID=A0ABU0ASG1_9BACI|nr:hypothetical protein [Cytobacillus purgationiresistens]MDQ0273960.1 hypothetical protein [Cytobacillus purgationiresistens]
MKKVILVSLLPFYLILSACTQNQTYDINEFSYGLGENESSQSSIKFEIEIIIPKDNSKRIDTSSIKPIVGSWVKNKVINVDIKDIKDNDIENSNLLYIKGEVSFDNEGLSYEELEKLNKKEPAFLGLSFINESKNSYDITFQKNNVDVIERK